MITRSLDKAKKAWKQKDPEASRLAHAAGTISRPSYEEHKKSGAFIKSAVYGGLDGIVTTFAIVAGVAGAELGPGIVLILGFANQLADGLSMAIGDYLGTKSEKEYQAAERRREEWEVDNYPEGEKKELIELYASKGLSVQDASTVVEIFAKNKKTWVDIMMVEELGILESDEHPIKNALVTFFSFVAFGFVPLLSYLAARLVPGFIVQWAFPLAIGLTAVTLFLLGTLKTRFTDIPWWKSGLEMLFVGGSAAGTAYGIGVLLKGLGV